MDIKPLIKVTLVFTLCHHASFGLYLLLYD